MPNISVVKRDGRVEALDLSKIQKQIALACEDISDVSPSMVEIKAQIQFHDKMSTVEIDNLLLRAMVDLIDETVNPDICNTNYQFVAGKQRIAMLRKSVYGSYNPPHLYTIIKNNIEAGVYTSDLLDWYTEEEWNTLELIIDHSKDEKLPIAAIEQFAEKYLVQNRATGQIYESPQVRYMVAAAVVFHKETKDRLKMVKEYYNLASGGAFTLATPVLAGLGTNTKQFSSCVLIKSDDTLDSIFASGEMMAKYASKRAGIGLDIGKLRALDAPIRGGEIKHTGIVPFIKKWFGDLRSCSQGGIRNASCTLWFPIWHYQFDDYIVMKNNAGTEENRVRQLDYGVVIANMFWRRLKLDENITFFDPVDVPDLYEAYYRSVEEFEALYLKYERNTKIRKKVYPAKVVFSKWLLKERTDTGRIYMMFIDNVIRQTPYNTNTHPVYQSNLCAEILLSNKEFQRIEDEKGRIALCTLASINYGYFKRPEDMKRTCQLVTRALNNILDYQDFLSIQSYLANQEFKPLGIGITNLAYWHAKRGWKYGDPEALAEVKRWQEHLAFYATEASIQLAEERGPCTLSHTTKYAQGQFPWDNRAPAVDELTDFTPALDWEPLRVRLKATGILNGLLFAIAPVESSSVVINSTNGISIPKQLISVKESKAGSFLQVVPDYNKLKNNYQMMYQDPDECIGYIKTAAVLSAYMDQSISADTFYSPKFYDNGKIPANLITENLMNGIRWGLKTVYYSLLEKTREDNTEDPELAQSYYDDGEEENCESCKL